MHKFEMSIMEYEYILKKRYKIILLCIILVMGSSLFFMRSQTQLYKAFSSVKIDKSKKQEDMLVTDSYWDNMETQVLVVNSFPVIELVAKDLGLVDSTIPSEVIKQNEKLIRTITGLSSKVSAKVRGSSTIIDITVVSANPTEAKNIANSVANCYKRFTRQEKSKAIRDTRVFIEQQLNACKASLAKNEGELKDLMRESQFPSLDEKIRRTIEQQSDLMKDNKELSGKIEAILSQTQDLQKRKEWSSFNINEKNKPDQQRPYMDWISGIGETDPGLEQMNRKLLELELQKSELLNFYNPTHPKLHDIETEIFNIISQILREYTNRVNFYQKKYAANTETITKLQETFKEIPEEQRQFSSIQRNISTNTKLYQLLSTRYQLALISEAGSADEVVVLSYAVTPNSPFNVNSSKVLIISLVLGIMLGVIIALVLETFDTSIGTIEDMEEYLQVPVIGVLPHIDKDGVLDIIKTRMGEYAVANDLPASHLISHFDPKSPDAEAYRSLRTNIQFLDIDKKIKVINFTSSVMREGKSTTLANLALTIAQAGYKILVIGCNLRRPSLYKTFGFSMGPGVVDILIEKEKWHNCIKTLADSEIEALRNYDQFGYSNLSNLHFIECGAIPPNPSELLQSRNMDKFLAEVREHYNIVLIDSPPTLPVTDSAILGTKVDGTVIVYQAGRVPRNALRRAKMKLESVKTKVLGLVLNDTKSEMSGYFSGYYKYYMDDKGSRKRKKKHRSATAHSLLFSLATGTGASVAVEAIRKYSLIGILAAAILGLGAFKAISPSRSDSERNKAKARELLPMKKSPVVPTPPVAKPAPKAAKPAEPIKALTQAPVPVTPTPAPVLVAVKVPEKRETPVAVKPQTAPAPAVKITVPAPIAAKTLVKKEAPVAAKPQPMAAPAVQAPALSIDEEFFFLQLSSLPTIELAQKERERLRKQYGIDVYIRPLVRDGKITACRVCFGAYRTRHEAQAALESFPIKRGAKNAFVNQGLAASKELAQLLMQY